MSHELTPKSRWTSIFLACSLPKRLSRSQRPNLKCAFGRRSCIAKVRHPILGRFNMREIAMPNPADRRPPVAIGHVRFNVTDVGAASRWLAEIGLRTIVSNGDLAVLELRGGTHLVVRQTERLPEPGTRAPFDLMFDDIDATHRIFEERGLSPSPIRRGRIHDSFEVIGPDGWVFTMNSSHASGQPI